MDESPEMHELDKELFSHLTKNGPYIFFGANKVIDADFDLTIPYRIKAFWPKISLRPAMECLVGYSCLQYSWKELIGKREWNTREEAQEVADWLNRGHAYFHVYHWVVHGGLGI